MLVSQEIIIQFPLSLSLPPPPSYSSCAPQTDNIIHSVISFGRLPSGSCTHNVS